MRSNLIICPFKPKQTDSLSRITQLEEVRVLRIEPEFLSTADEDLAFSLYVRKQENSIIELWQQREIGPGDMLLVGLPELFNVKMIRGFCPGLLIKFMDNPCKIKIRWKKSLYDGKFSMPKLIKIRHELQPFDENIKEDLFVYCGDPDKPNDHYEMWLKLQERFPQYKYVHYPNPSDTDQEFIDLLKRAKVLVSFTFWGRKLPPEVILTALGYQCIPVVPESQHSHNLKLYGGYMYSPVYLESDAPKRSFNKGKKVIWDKKVLQMQIADKLPSKIEAIMRHYWVYCYQTVEDYYDRIDIVYPTHENLIKKIWQLKTVGGRKNTDQPQ